MPVNREPWLAALLGTTVPGGGHAYAGARGVGVALAVLALALIAFSAWAFAAPAAPVAAGWAGIVLLVILLAASAGDAHHRCAREATPEFAAERRAGRDAWKAVFLSALFPGLGQFYAGRSLPGIAFVAAGLFAAPANDWPLVLAFVALRGGAMLDAWRGSTLRRGSPFATARVVSLGLTLLAAGQMTLVAFVRARVIQAFRIPNVSMAPTLSAGDCFFVDRTRRGHADAGDIVAFGYPPDPRQKQVKRVVAVGGQTVVIRDKQVFVDGKPLDEPYARYLDAQVHPDSSDNRDNMRPCTLPPGYYFVLGDNRDNSNDSRFWGALAGEALLGRVYKIYWPLGRAGSLRGR